VYCAFYSGEGDLMSGGRARRWVIGDTQRLLNRAGASAGTYATVEELRYLRDWCILILHGPLAGELSDFARARVERLHADAVSALQERAAERIEAP
jgi:hypothetical protein